MQCCAIRLHGLCVTDVAIGTARPSSVTRDNIQWSVTPAVDILRRAAFLSAVPTTTTAPLKRSGLPWQQAYYPSFIDLVSFLADRTDGRAYATVLRPSVSLSVSCLLLELRFQLHFMRWSSLSCFRAVQAVVNGCVCQSWIKKLLTHPPSVCL